MAGATPTLGHVLSQPQDAALAGLWPSLFGLDHVLAVIAVSLWAAVLGKQAFWLLPTAFSGAMLTGLAVTSADLAPAHADTVVAGSILILGLMVAGMVHLPLGIAAALTGLIGLCHGHQHEELQSVGALALNSASLGSTAVCYAAGLVIARGFAEGLDHTWFIRGLGWAIAFVGLWLAIRA